MVRTWVTLLLGLLVVEPHIHARVQSATAGARPSRADIARLLRDQGTVTELPARGKLKILSFNQTASAGAPVGTRGVVLLRLPEAQAPYDVEVWSTHKTGFGRRLPIFIPAAVVLDASLTPIVEVGEERLASGRGGVLLTVPIDVLASPRYVLVYTNGDLVEQLLPNRDEDFVNRRRVRASSGGGFYLLRSIDGNVEVSVKARKAD